MKSEHLSELENWLSNAGSDQNKSDLISGLRQTLGEIMKSVNDASRLFKNANREPSQENINSAAAILNDVENYQRIKQILPRIAAHFTEGEFKFYPSARFIMNMVHYLERANFTQRHVEILRTMSGGGQGASSEFPDEVNQRNQEKFLANAIYNNSDPGQKTLKVIRELLQNAVDNTHPKRHSQLQARPGFSPEVHLSFHQFSNYVDLMVEDKGTGMDWDVLRKKFFVIFDSGKDDQPGAAGGFGIAKSLIQNAPEHGWTVDTNGIHSSRFHKNIYFGTRTGDKYDTPSSEIRKNQDGATLTLHGLPKVYGFQVEELCKSYATNGSVKIFLNGREVEPSFLLDSTDVREIAEDSVDKVPDMVAGNPGEKQVAQAAFNSVREKLKTTLDDVGTFAAKNSKIKFYLKKSPMARGGKFYVMVNGQYQFDEDKYIDKLDVICSIETSARPGDDEYPLDPGRSHIRGPVKAKIDELINVIQGFSRDLSNDDLFQQGIESIVANEDAQPMSVVDSEEMMSGKQRILQSLESAVASDAFKKNEPSQTNQEQPGEESPKQPPQEQVQQVVEELVERVKEMTGSMPAIPKSAIAKAVVGILGDENRIEQSKKMNSLVNGLTTPGTILVQKNFVARDLVTSDLDMTGEMMILWQKTLKLLMKRLSSLVRYKNIADKKFIPGLVYSDECLGLWMAAKPELGRKYDSISINPMTVAAQIHPRLFMQKLEARAAKAFEDVAHEEEERSDESKSGSSDTPINRVAKFLFHTAVHEICHLLFPDRRSSSEEFHIHISRLETVCHDEFDKIRAEVRTHMPGLRSSTKKLINLVAKSKAKKTEHFAAESFDSWTSRRLEIENHVKKILDRPKLEQKVPNKKAATFREFLES